MRSAMRLMPLLLGCLMVGQATAARNLQVAADPTKRQFVQVAVTFAGKCLDVDAARLLRDNLVADVKAYFVGANKQSIADSVTGRLDTVCKGIKEGTSDFAGFRSAVSWVGLDNKDDQTVLFRGAKRNACTGGISPSLYPKLIAAANTAKYRIRYNQAGQWNPNIARGPVAYVDASNCNGTRLPPLPASPSPAPTPASPTPASPTPASPTPASPTPASPTPASPTPASPIPTPASPSPAPASPSPAPLTGCSTLVPNSVDDGTGKCVCTAPDFLVPAYHGTTLEACLATGAACPTAYPIPAKDGSGAVQQCLANINTCPTQYPFFLVAGDSAAIVECRPVGSACTFTGFAVQISDATSGSVVGCVKNDGQCPTAYPVAYRETATSFQLQKCDNAASCPKFIQNANPAVRFTINARTSSGQLVGCFTLNDYGIGATAGTCPALTAVNFPINVVGTDPDIAGMVKTLTCLAPNSMCPSSNPIQLFASTTVGAPPTVVTCALPNVLINGQCPTANLAAYPVSNGAYPLRIGPSDQVVGCTASTSTCPVAYPFPYYAAAKAGDPAILKQCRPTPGTDSCLNAGFTVPIYTSDTLTNANLVGCVDDTGVTTVCPTAYPVPYQDATLALKQCRPATIKACPTANSPAAIKTFTTPIVDATNKTVACIELPVGGCPSTSYPVAVKAIDNGNFDASTTIQCMPKGTVTCPTGYNFTLFDTKGVLQGCIPPQSASNCASSIFGTYQNGASVFDSSGAVPLLGCVQAAATACPPTYIPFWKTSFPGPVVSLLQCRTKLTSSCAAALNLPYSPNGPAPITGRDATRAAVACLDGTTACYARGFMIMVAPAVHELGIPTDCYTADATCPPTVADSNGQSQPSISLYYGGISTVLPNNVGKLYGCVAPVKGADGKALATCPGGTVFNYDSFTVPVYSDAEGSILVGCLNPYAQTPCPVDTLAIMPGVPITDTFGNQAFIVECRGGRTDCTFSSTAGASGADYSTYKVQVKDAGPSGTLRGCQEQVAAIKCPTAPVDYSFPLFGPDSTNATVVKECRPQPTQKDSCADTPYGVDYPVNINPAALVGCMASGTACPKLNNYNYPLQFLSNCL